MGRGNVSGVPYEGIVAELKNISSEMIEINRKLTKFNRTQRQINFLLEGITKKYNKKWFKKQKKISKLMLITS